MKNQLTLAFTLFVCYYISAQDKTIHENWYNGSLKKHLVLRGSDTLYFEYGYENGQTALKRWGRDSLYVFGYEGNVLKKFYGSVKFLKWNYSADSTISYDADVNLLLSNAKMGYAQNYYLKNGIWRILNIEDVIELTAASISKLNTLLSTKIKALKNEDLYCSSGLSFFDLGSQLSYINDKGLVFQYPRKINLNEYYYFEKRIVPITLTWEELQPFIKMKP